MKRDCADCEVLRRYENPGYHCENFRKAVGIEVDGRLRDKPLTSYCFHPYRTILVVGERDE